MKCKCWAAQLAAARCTPQKPMRLPGCTSTASGSSTMGLTNSWAAARPGAASAAAATCSLRQAGSSSDLAAAPTRAKSRCKRGEDGAAQMCLHDLVQAPCAGGRACSRAERSGSADAAGFGKGDGQDLHPAAGQHKTGQRNQPTWVNHSYEPSPATMATRRKPLSRRSCRGRAGKAEQGRWGRARG